MFVIKRPHLSHRRVLQLFSDPHINDLYRYFQAGSVAAYEHIAMIKLHYSLVDTMEECVRRLERNGNKKQRKSRNRTKIFIPESKDRASVEVPETRKFTVDASIPLVKNAAVTKYVHKGSFSTETVGFDEDDDEDEFERGWVE